MQIKCEYSFMTEVNRSDIPAIRSSWLESITLSFIFAYVHPIACLLSSSQENSSDSVTSSSRGESGRPRQNGERSDSPPQNSKSQRTGKSSGAQGREEGTLVSEHKVQVTWSTRTTSWSHNQLPLGLLQIHHSFSSGNNSRSNNDSY